MREKSLDLTVGSAFLGVFCFTNKKQTWIFSMLQICSEAEEGEGYHGQFGLHDRADGDQMHFATNPEAVERRPCSWTCCYHHGAGGRMALDGVLSGLYMRVP